MKKDVRIDEYIAKANSFAQPILVKMRELVHRACPGVEETIKWGMPSFDYKGPMFSMAAFKAHCTGGFWKAKLLTDPHKYLDERKSQGGEAMGHFGKMTSLDEMLSDDVFIDFIRQHMRLNDEGVKLAKPKKVAKELVVPEELIAALESNATAQEVFEKFPPSQKREYADWIIEAKTDETRAKRLQTTISQLQEGKPRNWKYMKEYQQKSGSL